MAGKVGTKKAEKMKRLDKTSISYGKALHSVLVLHMACIN